MTGTVMVRMMVVVRMVVIDLAGHVCIALREKQLSCNSRLLLSSISTCKITSNKPLADRSMKEITDPSNLVTSRRT